MRFCIQRSIRRGCRLYFWLQLRKIILPIPKINFHDIKTHQGSQHSGFEELCCQIARVEFATNTARFMRKGSGGDGGVEALVYRKDGGKTGVQAKYVFLWDNSLKQQLDKSISKALKSDPGMDEYIVCLPFDLPGGVVEGKVSALGKWQAWVSDWAGEASKNGRSLKVSLWGQSELLAFLTSPKSGHIGRIEYWFGGKAFDRDWFEGHLQTAKVTLGRRYSEENHVDIALKEDLLGLCRDNRFKHQLESWAIDLAKAGVKAAGSLPESDKYTAEVRSRIYKETSQLASLLEPSEFGPTHELRLSEWLSSCNQLNDLTRDGFRAASSLNGDRAKGSVWSPREAAYHYIGELHHLVSDMLANLSGRAWGLAARKNCLLIGEAGIGKSHTLADLVQFQLTQDRPAILLLGQRFWVGEPWRQIISLLGLPGDCSRDTLLGALDAAAEANGCRFLFCIDALNENTGLNIWPNHLTAFVNEVLAYPHICLILSCRTTYVGQLIPSELDDDALMRVIHPGFAGDGGRAAKAYLASRNIVLPGAPNYSVEFGNPLFLRTCCDYLEKSGSKEFPKGLKGISAVFEFYHKAAVQSVTLQLRLDPALKLIEGGIIRLVNHQRDTKSQFTDYAKAHGILNSGIPNPTSRTENALAALVNEGVLTTEIWEEEGSEPEQYVRFTFERFSDYMLADALINDHVDDSDPLAAFRTGGGLHEFVFGESAYRNAGVIEAIAVHLPERFGEELLDAIETPGSNDWVAHQAFEASIRWRAPKYFSDRAYKLISKALPEDRLLDLLIELSTEPDNPYNAHRIDCWLNSFSMPERDEIWTAYLMEADHDGAAPITLIEWAVENGFETIHEDRAKLAAIMLAWFLTASNRFIRDRATKALAALFGPRSDLAVDLIEHFEATDEPYLFERLVAAAYGGALQSFDSTNLQRLADAAYSAVFEGEDVTDNALTRDHARGIILFAQERGLLSPDIDVSKTVPPHAGACPIEHVPDSLIETYTTEFRDGYTSSDSIVSSVINDGDFARYVMDGVVDDWSSSSVEAAQPLTRKEVFEAWEAAFRSTASSEAQHRFSELLKTVLRHRGKTQYPDSPERKEIEEAHEAFRLALSGEAWEEFRVNALSFVRHGYFESEFTQNKVDHFDPLLARRWVCKRAHDLGWTNERFQGLERSMRGADRHDHKCERIGKKYQWIAFHELIGRLSDNHFYLGPYLSNRTEYQSYVGAHQIRLRDIDPSLLLTNTARRRDREVRDQRYWWSPISTGLPACSSDERLLWLRSSQDVFSDPKMIEVTNPEDERKWLVLGSFRHWSGHGVVDGESSLQRDVWCRISCLVVRKSDKTALLASLEGEQLTDPHSLPRLEYHSNKYLGEFPWHPSLVQDEEWNEPDRWSPASVPVRAVVASYTCERGGHDYSIDESVSVEMPASWLARLASLRLLNGRRPAFVDADLRERFIDPSVAHDGPSAALIDRGTFLRSLEQEGLEPVWIIAGEKGAHGGHKYASGWGGSRYFTGVYHFDAGEIKGTVSLFAEDPSDEQFRVFSEGADLSRLFEEG